MSTNKMILHDDNDRNLADQSGNDGEMTIDKVDDDKNDYRDDNDEKMDAKKVMT